LVDWANALANVRVGHGSLQSRAAAAETVLMNIKWRGGQVRDLGAAHAARQLADNANRTVSAVSLASS